MAELTIWVFVEIRGKMDKVVIRKQKEASSLCGIKILYGNKTI
jgi:hypothetical protein